jgi:hypothetical protein
VSAKPDLPANWLDCTACRRAGTWWDLNTLGCTHATGCALDAAREREHDTTKEAT